MQGLGCDNECWDRRGIFGGISYGGIFISQLFLDNTLYCDFELFVVEATSIIPNGDDSFENLVDIKYFLRKSDVFFNTLFYRLSHYYSRQMKACTIRNLPSIIAIKPPVLVPPIKSKYSHGNGVSAVCFRLPISSISCRRISRDDNPRTPPPSSDRIRGQSKCAIAHRFSAHQIQYQSYCRGYQKDSPHPGLAPVSLRVSSPKIEDVQ